MKPLVLAAIDGVQGEKKNKSLGQSPENSQDIKFNESW